MTIICPCMLYSVHVMHVIHIRVYLRLFENVPACKWSRTHMCLRFLVSIARCIVYCAIGGRNKNCTSSPHPLSWNRLRKAQWCFVPQCKYLYSFFILTWLPLEEVCIWPCSASNLALQEMSPIDIVPVAPQAHEETFYDTTQVDVGFANPAFSLTERSGTTPRRANGHVKPVRIHLCHFRGSIIIHPKRTYVGMDVYVICMCLSALLMGTWLSHCAWAGFCMLSRLLLSAMYYVYSNSREVVYTYRLLTDLLYYI